MSRLESSVLFLSLVLLTTGCDELGNPKQLTTGPTIWVASGQELATTTRSFRNAKTIRRIVDGDLEGLDYVDASIGPEDTLTLVTVAPRRLRPIRPGATQLATRFSIEGHPPIIRQWRGAAGSRLWGAAFALPAPPTDAITSLVPATPTGSR